MKKGALFATGILAATAANAQHYTHPENEFSWVRKAIRSQCEWYESCKYRYRYIHVKRYYQQEARREPDPYRHLEKCKPAIRVWGDQAQSRDNAYNRAVVSWTGATRFQYGEVYIDFSIAEDVKVLCSPSSVSDTITSKLQEKVFNTEYFRCEVQARPCRPKRKED